MDETYLKILLGVIVVVGYLLIRIFFNLLYALLNFLYMFFKERFKQKIKIKK